MSIILVHIGSTIPHYIYDNLYQIFNRTQCPVYIVLSNILVHTFKKEMVKLKNWRKIIIVSDSSLKLEKNHNTYKNFIKNYNLTFRDNFWISTTSRFFYIAACMKQYDLTNIYHIENDNMIYFDTIDPMPMNKIYLVKDSDNRVIPSIIYIHNHEQADDLCNFISKTVQSSTTFINDMEILSKYPNAEYFNCDPSSNENVYDGCAIGQYLGNVDPRNKNLTSTLDRMTQPSGFINETCFFKVSDYIIKKVDQDYFIKGNKIMNLHIHSKQLYQFSDKFSVKYEDIITGDRIVELCDYIITTRQIDNYHKNIEHLNSKKIFIDETCTINIPNKEVKVFVYQHILYAIKDLLRNWPGTLKLYVHNSDHAFIDDDILDIPQIKSVYAQNINTKVYDKLICLPIGLQNSMHCKNNLIIMYEIMSKCYKYKKTKNIFINLNSNTYPYRETVKQECKKLKLNISTILPFKEYLQELSIHKYSLCIRGNGLDTHRFWESVYLGVIPIVLNDEVTQMTNFLMNLRKTGVYFIEINKIEELLNLPDKSVEYLTCPGLLLKNYNV